MANSLREVNQPMLKFGILSQSISMSLKNILGNKKRSFLTMLGIIIGVAAVIALITTVSGVSDYIMDQFSQMGAGSLSISVYGTPLKSGLTENDMNEIYEIENVSGVSPSVSVSTKVTRNMYISDDVSISGINEQYFFHNDCMTYGRPLRQSDMDGSVYVCTIDTDCAETFFRGEDPIGKTIKIGGIQYTVIGLCSNTSNILAQLYGMGKDGSIFIPYKNALSLNGRNRITSLSVYVDDSSKTNDVSDRIEVLLDNTFNNADNAYSIINMESLTELMDKTSDIMTGLLAGIASIALLVGGIGIMNMMLVSVTERTKEIGLRKALGAEPKVIQLQFLLESIILSVIGGFIGIVLGEIISYIANDLIGTDFILNISAILIGFFFSLAVGVIFGWAPARNASKLNPIDALRSE